MTTQLWGWKCNWQDEFGYELSNRSHDGSRRFARIDSGTSGFMRDTRFITDLHKVEVVDADAVVIEKDVIHFDKFLNEVIEVSGSNYDFNYTKSQKVHECAMYLQYKIYPTPPVTKTSGWSSRIGIGVVMAAQAAAAQAVIKDKMPTETSPILDDGICNHILKLALGAVVELHKPLLATNELKCSHCEDSGWNQPYPCATIQAIEKELR